MKLLTKTQKVFTTINNDDEENDVAGKCATGNGGDYGGETVIVGVKFDQRSKQLLTWALINVAQPGDHIVALHVLHSSSTMVEQSTLISFLKSCDSTLAELEGFCKLKQVDLKLKLCRGSPLRKILVQETKAYKSGTLIVGTCKAQRMIRSSTSVATYCGRKLPNSFLVFAVDSGKIVYLRKAVNEKTPRLVFGSKVDNVEVDGDGNSSIKTKESGLQSCDARITLIKRDGRYDRSLAWLPYQPTGVSLAPLLIVNQEQNKFESGWSLLRKLVLPRLKSDKVLSRKTPRLVSGSKVDNVKVDGDGDSSIKTKESDQQSSEAFEKHYTGARSTLIKSYVGCEPSSASADFPCDEMQEESCDDGRENRSLASVLFINQELNGFTCGWPLFRRLILHRHKSDKVPTQKTSMVRPEFRLPGRQSSMSVCPDRWKHESAQMDDQLSDPIGEVASSGPPSTFKGLKIFTKELEELHEKYSSTCRLFAYQELLSATSSFAPENMVGKGGSSQVYRGCFPGGKELAVKLLKPSNNALQEIITEIEIITTISHKNILSLIGYCFEEEKIILVYDFLSRGSIEENLHCNETKAGAFRWEERYKVAVGVAEALDYLHNRDLQSVIHRDVKSSNILLSDEFGAQVADFGLATWSSNASSYTSSDVGGTFGYLAPEYFMHGKVTDKMDVYSFGVVILELLSGRQPIDGRNPKGNESLVIWANSVLKDEKLSQFLDPRIGSCYDHDQIDRMILAATLCIRREPRTRPGIGNILKLLQGDIEVINWAKQQVNNYPADFEVLDGETPRSDIQSHLNMALLDIVDDGSTSVSSSEPILSVQDYLKGRWSHSSSFE